MINLENSNYCGTVVNIQRLIPLDNCDNLQHANIFGNLVIIDKSTKLDDIGIFFPAECELSEQYLSNNNLYRDNSKNLDKNKKGYFEQNGRIRAVKLRGNSSNGLFMPLESIDFTGVKKIQLGDEFNSINSIPICKKYIIKKKTPGLKTGKRGRKPKISKIIDGQFRFHYDTDQLGKNISRIHPQDFIHISYKLHGTSGISSNVLCKRKLNIFEKFLKLIGVKINDTEYQNIYSSRRVVKNDDLNNTLHFYKSDIWGKANDIIKDYISSGMTVYYEIVGFTPDGQSIQPNYDYGCNDNQFEIYIYRMTYTAIDNKIYEFTARQVREWCEENGFNCVPELYYGRAVDFDNRLKCYWESLMDLLKEKYLKGNCFMCNNQVPVEGIVIRIDGKSGALKYKSNDFYEWETKQLDKGNVNMEDDQ
jgi:hypothetical protein